LFFVTADREAEGFQKAKSGIACRISAVQPMGGAEDSLQTTQNFLVIPLLVRSEVGFQPLYF
jgi:hypothetical protein